MTRSLGLTWLVVACLGLGCGGESESPGQAPVRGDYALVGVTVIDATGRAPQASMTVVVEGERIVALGPQAQVALADGVRVIDAAGRYVIPGLIDMHVHHQPMETVFPPLYVANGVTTVREMSGAPFLLDWRQRIRERTLLGPRLIVSSPIVDGSPSLWQNSPISHLVVTSADEGREAVRQSQGAGYDFLKVYSRLSPGVFGAISDEARQRGFAFAGHCPDEVPLADAIEAGQASFEHLYGLLWATSASEEKLHERIEGITFEPDSITGYNAWFQQTHAIEWEAARDYSQEKAAALFARMVARGAAQVPTLVLHQVLDRPMDLDPDDDRARYLPRSAFAGWQWQLGEIYLAGRSDEEAAQRQQIHARRLALVGALRAAGVTILAGTDAMTPWSFPGFSLHDELAALVSAGLSPLESLQAATREPARFLGLSDVGTVEVGKVADLVVLDADPLDDIRNTRRIEGVAVRGRWIASDERAALLQGIEAAAAGL